MEIFSIDAFFIFEKIRKGGYTMLDEKIKMREEILAEIREANRLYKKEWRKRNPDKVKASNERYWIKKVESLMKEKKERE